MVNLNYEQNGEDVLVDQAKKFLESTLATWVEIDCAVLNSF